MGPSKIASANNIANLSECVAAYIAGLIDADGTVTVMVANKTGRPDSGYPLAMVLVVNGNLGLIRWLKSAIGAGCAYETKTRPIRPDQNEAHWNPVHRYQVLGFGAQSLLMRCLPHMRVKKAQADLVCSVPIRGIDFPQRASPEQRERAFAILNHIRTLNQRGKKATYQYDLVGP